MSLMYLVLLVLAFLLPVFIDALKPRRGGLPGKSTKDMEEFRDVYVHLDSSRGNNVVFTEETLKRFRESIHTRPLDSERCWIGNTSGASFALCKVEDLDWLVFNYSN